MAKPKTKLLTQELLESAGPAVTQEDRVAIVFGAMRSLCFPPGADRELRELWSLSPAEMTIIVAEAKGMMRGATSEDRDDLRAEMHAQLGYIAEQAMKKKKYIVVKGGQGEGDSVETLDDPDFKAATAALNTAADILGLKVKKHEHEHTAGDADVDDIVRKLSEKFARKPILTEGTEQNEQRSLPERIAASAEDNPVGYPAGIDPDCEP